MERVHTEWLRSLGFELDALRLREGLLFVVRQAEICICARPCSTTC